MQEAEQAAELHSFLALYPGYCSQRTYRRCFGTFPSYWSSWEAGLFSGGLVFS